jgi:hypothetical protein
VSRRTSIDTYNIVVVCFVIKFLWIIQFVECRSSLERREGATTDRWARRLLRPAASSNFERFLSHRSELVNYKMLLQQSQREPGDCCFRAVPGETARDVRDHSCRRTTCAAPSMSLLRRPHDHHRDLRRRLPATPPANRASRGNQCRYLMSVDTSHTTVRSPRCSSTATMLLGPMPAQHCI